LANKFIYYIGSETSEMGQVAAQIQFLIG